MCRNSSCLWLVGPKQLNDNESLIRTGGANSISAQVSIASPARSRAACNSKQGALDQDTKMIQIWPWPSGLW